MNLPVLNKNSLVHLVEDELLAMEQVECPVFHRFAPGLYIREVFIPHGTFSIGHHQKLAHFNSFLKGKVLMIRDDGSTEILEAPMQFTSDSGRKVGIILEDMVWQNIYPNPDNEKDIEKLEARFIDKCDKWKQSEAQKFAIDKINREPDRIDYLLMLNEEGFTDEIARKQSEDESDRIDIDILKVQIGQSPIEGKGLFATARIKAGDIIGPARISGMRTIAGRYTNHSKNPNAQMVVVDRDIFLQSIKDIHGNKGGQLGEEITVDYRQALAANRQSLK